MSERNQNYRWKMMKQNLQNAISYFPSKLQQFDEFPSILLGKPSNVIIVEFREAKVFWHAFLLASMAACTRQPEEDRHVFSVLTGAIRKHLGTQSTNTLYTQIWYNSCTHRHRHSTTIAHCSFRQEISMFPLV